MRRRRVAAMAAFLFAVPPAGASGQDRAAEVAGPLARVGALLSADSLEAARAHLEDVRGVAPDAPWLDEMAALLRLAGGDVSGGRDALLIVAAGAEPARATGLIQLAALAGRLSPRGGVLLGRGAGLAAAGRPGEAARLLGGGAAGGEPGDGAPLLAQAARWADGAGEGGGGAAWRERILAEFPELPEAEESALALARYLGSDPVGKERAVALLQALLERTPGGVLAPDARRELERLRGGA